LIANDIWDSDSLQVINILDFNASELSSLLHYPIDFSSYKEFEFTLKKIFTIFFKQQATEMS